MGIKLLHLLSAYGLFAIFLLRGLAAISGSTLASKAWPKILFHIATAGLVLSAIGLAVSRHEMPFTVGWTSAKLVALIIFIGAGVYLFKKARTQQQKRAAFLGGVILLVYIFAVALTRSVFVFA
ncbi:MAG: SirB2 family protein [Gammaproteobacteria bacterium]|nr:SirB2 family protein [Gammaproteobacteria bacterium]